MEQNETCSKQTEQLSLENRIRNLRAEGKTYREIAEIAHVSIAQISRILNEPKEKEETASTQEGELASRVFQLLEKGRTLSQIVIRLKLEPEVVKDLYGKWVGLNQTDVNQPNLDKLDRKLESHISAHFGLDRLLEKAWNSGVFRRDNCANRSNNPDGTCEFSPCKGEDTDDAVLCCAFCHRFRSEEVISVDLSPYAEWPNV